jgi:hypothetical protein
VSYIPVTFSIITKTHQTMAMEEVTMELLQYVAALGGGLLLFSSCLIRYFASPRTSCGVQILATLAFSLAFSGTLLLPIDLSMSYAVDGDDKNE